MKEGIWKANKVEDHIDALINREEYYHQNKGKDSLLDWQRVPFPSNSLPIVQYPLPIISYSLPVFSKNGKYMLIREFWSADNIINDQVSVYKKKGEDWEHWIFIPNR